ncbi:MAG TPA: sigma factor-like helix-turn-helix DNA-binding protein [Chthonomonadaceae bacterium]|nr:sigma factor-like helix-turn-helix DNA-binding protein [Chthonomonadaceae bacterium]
MSLLRLDVEQALRRLPCDQSHAIALFYLGGISIREIARRTGRPEGTIKSWLLSGRRQLAIDLKEYAPMQPTEWTAALVSTDLEPAALRALSDALRSAGYSQVNHLSKYLELARLEETGEGDAKEFHLPGPLRATRLIVLDERIGGHSAFELFPILRAAAEGKEMAACILLDPAEEQDSRARVLSAWASGFDLCLTKPVKPKEFERFAKIIRERLAA